MEMGQLCETVFQYSGSKYHEKGWKKNMQVFATVYRLGEGGAQPAPTTVSAKFDTHSIELASAHFFGSTLW